MPVQVITTIIGIVATLLIIVSQKTQSYYSKLLQVEALAPSWCLMKAMRQMAATLDFLDFAADSYFS